MIHCIGDSHVSVFTGTDIMPNVWHTDHRSKDITEYFKTYRIGPATATGLYSKIPVIDDIIEKSPINKNNDKILFCFGEVDIRAHIAKEYIEKNKNLEELLEISINEYIKVILFYKNMGYEIMVWGPIASWSEESPYITGPTFGTNLQRNYITNEFNKLLEKKCQNNNIIFITIFEEMLLENGNTNHYYLDKWEGCHIHLAQTSYPLILKKFKEKKLIN